MSKWIKKGDKVVIIAGSEKGKTGEVISRREESVVVQGANIRKRHIKRRAKAGAGEIIEMEKPIHISNVAICTEDGKPVKLKVKFSSDGKKQLFYLDGQKEIIYREIKKS